MSKLSVFTSNETVNAYQIDFNKRMRLGKFCVFMQDAAYHHAKNLS